jgi:ATP-dependent DNA helicase DinG
VILDEAHAVPQIAAQCLGARLDAPAVSAAVSKAARACGAGGRGFRDVKKTVSAIEGLARAFFGTFTGGGGAPRVRYDRFSLPDGAVEAHIGLDGALAGLCGALEKAGRKEGAPPEIALAGLGIERIRAVLADLVEARDGSFVYYSEPAPRGVLLAAEPVEPGEILRERFYPMLGTAVFTSATLSAGGGLGYSAARLGLDGLGCEALEFASPFDYTAQAALYLPKAIPDPNSPGFTGAAIAEIDALTRITGGRAFVLCTSRRQMEAYHAALRDGLPYSVLIQGEIPKREILERFRKGGPCVLFATSSFWEGVDVPGEALSLVIIDRIPFDPPGDPVNEARAELARSRGHDPFRSFQLPEAALALKQGFGRLIRTVTDRGIAAILDPRLKTRSYGRYLLKTLPAMNTFDDTGDLKAWWEKTRG